MVNSPIIPTADLLPRREPGLIERVFRAVVKAEPSMGPQPAQQASTQSGVLPQLMQQLFGQYFTSPYDRLAIYKDVEEMDQISEEVGLALDVITNNATTSEDGVQMSFKAESENAEVTAILEKVGSDADLARMVKPIIRASVKYGDCFSEVVVNGEWDVVGVRILPPSSMFRNQDTRGNLHLGMPQYDASTNRCTNKPGECAFEQRSEDNRTIVAAFRPWQIAHTRLNWDGVDVYGKSMLRVTRITWKKLHALEEGLIIGRLTRAFLKLVFHIDTTGLPPKEKDNAVTKFRESIITRQKMDGRRENPFYVLSDIFLADGYVNTPDGKTQQSRSRVELIDPKNEAISAIDDVKYLHRKLLATIRVPPAHLGFEEDVNAKATLGWEDVNYIRFIRDVQQTIGQTLEQIYDTALVLKGYDPKTVEYDITWPRLSASDEAADAKAEFDRAQADSLYAEIGVIDAAWIQEHRFDMSEDEIADISARVLKAKQDEMDQAQASADDAHSKNLEVIKTKAAVGGPQDNPKPANGKMSQEWVDALREIAQPVKNGGKGHAVATSVNMLAESIRSRAQENLRVDLERIFAEQREARQAVQGMVGEMTKERPTQMPLAAPQPAIGKLDVHAHINADIKPADVHPTPVHVDAPEVHNEVTVEAAKAPDVKVENTVQVPAQKPPTVNVRPQVSAPDVKVEAHLDVPKVDVTVQSAPAQVITPPVDDREVEIIRDDRGNVTGAKRVPKKKER